MTKQMALVLEWLVYGVFFTPWFLSGWYNPFYGYPLTALILGCLFVWGVRTYLPKHFNSDLVFIFEYLIRFNLFMAKIYLFLAMLLVVGVLIAKLIIGS